MARLGRESIWDVISVLTCTAPPRTGSCSAISRASRRSGVRATSPCASPGTRVGGRRRGWRPGWQRACRRRGRSRLRGYCGQCTPSAPAPPRRRTLSGSPSPRSNAGGCGSRWGGWSPTSTRWCSRRARRCSSSATYGGRRHLRCRRTPVKTLPGVRCRHFRG